MANRSYSVLNIFLYIATLLSFILNLDLWLVVLAFFISLFKVAQLRKKVNNENITK